MKVSVCITTYNHEKYIAQAIEGALMQKTNFDYEMLVGEDDSKDGTREICIEYAKKYPNKIRLFLNDRKNVIYIQGRPTGRWNFVNLLKNATGKYIAICEGDDYWTSAEKLQKQFDFLENHPECSTVFHWADFFEECDGKIVKKVCGPPMRKQYYTVDDLLENNNFIPTCSVMFRNGLFKEFPAWFSEAEAGDFVLHILNARHGKIGFIDESLSVYRRHAGGLWAGNTNIDNAERTIRLYLLIGQKLDYLTSEAFKKGLLRWIMYRQRLAANNNESARDMNDFRNRLAEYFRKLASQNTPNQ